MGKTTTPAQKERMKRFGKKAEVNGNGLGKTKSHRSRADGKFASKKK